MIDCRTVCRVAPVWAIRNAAGDEYFVTVAVPAARRGTRAAWRRGEGQSDTGSYPWMRERR